MFGFSLSGSAQKSKTTTDTTNSFTNTTTRNVPQWGSDLVEKGAARVGELFNLDPGGQVAPTNALLTGAAGSAAGLSGSGVADTSWLNPYMAADTPFASGGKAYDYVGRYLNPYLSEVVDASAADMDAQAGTVRAQQALDLAGSGAFGGSGAALTQSMTEGELARARGATDQTRGELAELRSRVAASDQALQRQVAAFNEAALSGEKLQAQIKELSAQVRSLRAENSQLGSVGQTAAVLRFFQSFTSIFLIILLTA